MKKAIKINAKRVKALRMKSGLSQKQLAAKVEVFHTTVSRWERGEIVRLRPDDFGKLSAVLGATEADLSGEGPLPENSTANQELQTGDSIACKNALRLVAARYGVTRQQIMAAAPLLFIAAEQSLQERKERLSALRDEADAELSRAIKNRLGLSIGTGQSREERLCILSDAAESILAHALGDEKTLGSEESSIENRDLFGKISADGPATWWYEKEGSPFAGDLGLALARVCADAGPVEWKPGSTPSYRICGEQAAALVGDDEEAVNAILCGAAALHEMPPHIRKSSPSERAQWARSELRRQRDARPTVLDIDL
jgi:transcriptional regulator with XRE-family HTH domain